MCLKSAVPEVALALSNWLTHHVEDVRPPCGWHINLRNLAVVVPRSYRQRCPFKNEVARTSLIDEQGSCHIPSYRRRLGDVRFVCDHNLDEVVPACAAALSETCFGHGHHMSLHD